MNKKGFTLVELLAVIVILAILISIAVPSTIAISNKLKENMYCKKIDSIEVAAKLYGEDRRNSFPSNGYTDETGSYSGVEITVTDLINSGYLKKDNNVAPFVVDPRDNVSMDTLPLNVYIKYERVYVHFNDTVNKTCKK